MMTAAEAERALAEALALPRPRLRDLPRGAILTDTSEEVAYLRAYIPWMRMVETMRRYWEAREEGLRRCSWHRGRVRRDRLE